MNPSVLADWGRTIVSEMLELMDDNKFPVIVYRGMSGIAAATAMSIMIPPNKQGDFGMIYVRKKGEKAHGGKMEYTNLNRAGYRPMVFIIVDDFIQSGATVLEICKAVTSYFDVYLNPTVNVRYAMTSDPYALVLKLHESIRHADGYKVVARLNQQYEKFYAAHKVKMEEAAKKKCRGIERIVGHSGLMVL